MYQESAISCPPSYDAFYHDSYSYLARDPFVFAFTIWQLRFVHPSFSVWISASHSFSASCLSVLFLAAGLLSLLLFYRVLLSFVLFGHNLASSGPSHTTHRHCWKDGHNHAQTSLAHHRRPHVHAVHRLPHQAYPRRHPCHHDHNSRLARLAFRASYGHHADLSRIPLPPAAACRRRLWISCRSRCRMPVCSVPPPPEFRRRDACDSALSAPAQHPQDVRGRAKLHRRTAQSHLCGGAGTGEAGNSHCGRTSKRPRMHRSILPDPSTHLFTDVSPSAESQDPRPRRQDPASQYQLRVLAHSAIDAVLDLLHLQRDTRPPAA